MSIFPSSMPFDDIKIIDQSGYVEETIVEAPFIPSGPIAFIPFISPRGYGEDNKLMYMTGSKLAKYGKPNLKKYGLSLYLAKRFIEGGGTVLGMRVTNDNFYHANFCVSASVEKKEIPKYETRKDSSQVESYHPIFAIDGSDNTISFEEIFLTDKKDLRTMSAKIANDIVNLMDIDPTGDPPASKISVVINSTATDLTIVTKGTGATKVVEKLVKPGDADVEYTPILVDSLNVSYEVSSVEEAKKLEDIEAGFIEDYTQVTTTDQGGNKVFDPILSAGRTIPLFFVAAKAAGSFANNFKARFIKDDSQNAYINMVEDDAFTYKFIDSENNSKLDENISFSFNDDYRYKNESMAIEDVFDSYTENVIMKKVGAFDDFMAIVEYYCCDKNDVRTKDNSINKIDILFGTNIPDEIYLVDTDTSSSEGKEVSVDLARDTGFSFKNGAEEAQGFTFKSDPFADALVKAYSGEVTDLIYDHIRYPYQYLFAPSFDSDLMDAIHELATINRKCTGVSYFVCGSKADVPASYQEARGQREVIPADSWKEDIFPEWARVYDTYTGRKVFMPSVYFTAYTYPNHWNTRRGKPLAGRKNAIWSGFDIGTVTPASSSTDEYIANHNVGFNTMVEDGLGNAVMYEQITAQANNSRLSEINNRQVLHEMVKIALKIANDNRWADLGDNEINVYKTSVESAIATNLRDCYERVEVQAMRESVNGAGRNRILCKINVLFKDMLKGVSYEFYILAQ